MYETTRRIDGDGEVSDVERRVDGACVETGTRAGDDDEDVRSGSARTQNRPGDRVQSTNISNRQRTCCSCRVAVIYVS